MVKGLISNRALVVLVVVDIFIVSNQILAGTNMTYLFNDYLHNKEAMSIASLLFTYGTVVVLSPFATALTRRFGKKEASVVALMFSSIMYLLMYFLYITNVWVYLFLLFIATLGSGLFNLMVWAFITDVIDYYQYTTGLREDGTVYGVNSFARKLGQACAGAIGGFMLTMIGYQSSSVGGAIQSALVQERIYMITNLLPAVCLLLSAVILLVGYPLNKKETIKMGEKLKQINR
ncbi:MFS transporter [Enterococcus thailandicus]|nr:MFS transporter [Enterococcus thailandicus]MDA3974835.1 MFS transporter [Enterococcus thailandicus]MDA3977321.1 MFS transporter [Enterococcus thailandicus]